MSSSWDEFLQKETLFSNAIRLRYLVWTIQRHVPSGSRIVEVGCGSGRTAILLADLGYRVVGLEIDPSLVKRIRAEGEGWIRTDRLEIREGDMLALPWGKREFALAYHQGVLEHFTDDVIVEALKQQRRVADIVIFDVPNHRHGDHPFGDERLLRPRHWHDLIERSGLTVMEERGRDFSRKLYGLPAGFFSRTAVERLGWFGRWFGANSIFVCRPSLGSTTTSGERP